MTDPIAKACFGMLWVMCSVVACSDGEGDGSSGQSSSGQGPGEHPIVIHPSASDEALDELLAADAVDDPSQTVVVTEPQEDDTVNLAELTFSYQVQPTEAAGPRSNTPRYADRSPRSANPLDAISSWLIGTAHAHGPPVNGRGYLLTFSDADGTILAQAFTVDLSYDPTNQIEAAMIDRPQPLSVVIDNAIFDNNAIVEDGGPFAGVPRTFRIEP